jgi:hypothetical protein
VSPVKYELGFYIPGDDILHSHCCEHLKSDIVRLCYRRSCFCAVKAYGGSGCTYPLELGRAAYLAISQFKFRVQSKYGSHEQSAESSSSRVHGSL